ncbi:RmlC-like cupin domain-containing protein [Rhypophila decipiens]|uniref:RmlC-like cupin domain-containing protein n=1 Tax=Rhypophila decipiens TaxID=261697 RepID=A0AAN6YFH1_9PEZI|nr:RmlC-like cupin domain-containing protein [Rhypophila decipiens]
MTISTPKPESPLTPYFPVPTKDTSKQAPKEEAPQIDAVINALKMLPHIEGGYYAETDRDPRLVPSPFPDTPSSPDFFQRQGFNPSHRNASTTIYYLITPNSPQGNFHRNRARTVHTLHRGRGRYVLIHADEEGKEKRVESFVVGLDVARGEKPQWIVEGGKYKASYLLPDVEGGEGGGEASGWLLISETVVPGFEFFDHDFLTKSGLKELVGEEKAAELDWLARE